MKTCLFAAIITSLILPLYAQELSSEVRKLQTNRNKAVKKIDLKYKAELNKLKEKYTKKGDLDQANAIVALMDAIVIPDTVTSKPPLARLEGKWQKEHGGGYFIFDERGIGEWFPNGRNPIKCKASYDRWEKEYTFRTPRFTIKMSETDSPNILHEKRKAGVIKFTRAK